VFVVFLALLKGRRQTLHSLAAYVKLCLDWSDPGGLLPGCQTIIGFASSKTEDKNLKQHNVQGVAHNWSSTYMQRYVVWYEPHTFGEK